MDYRDLCRRLVPVYGEREAKAIGRLVMEETFGLSWSDLLMDRNPEGEAEQHRLAAMTERLAKGEPVQYVLGEADFYGRRFRVTPDVLIPRPETAELCQWVVADVQMRVACRVLDIGTGSGCIAVTLAAELKNSRVAAWDISEAALAVARENAERTGVHVSFRQVDILDAPHDDGQTAFDVIVSNPPYICCSEASGMEVNVLEHEPHLALFVPDDDPLLFYRAIGRYACKALADGGALYLEINPLYAAPLAALLAEQGFSAVEKRDDDYGKTRFIKAKR